MGILERTAIRLAGSALFSAGFGRLLLRRWRNNPSPHGDRAPIFPGNQRRSVLTDDGAYLSVAVAGEGPSIVLVHGITANANDWGYVADDLVAAGHTVYAIDQRGHGASTVGSDGFGGPRLGRDVATVLEKLDINGCVLAGHSMGGIAAMSFAVDHPQLLAERVVGIGLISTISRSDTLVQRAGLLSIRADWSAINTAPNVARIAAGLTVFGSPRSLTLIDHVLASARQMNPENRVAAARALGTYNVARRISKISTPVAIIHGTRDLVIPVMFARFLARAIRTAELHDYRGAGHQIIWERTPEIVRHLIDLSR